MKKLFERKGLLSAATTIGAALTASSIAVADPHTEALEKRLQIMEEQMQLMQDELVRVKEDAEKPSEKVLELEQWVHSVNKIGPMERKNQVFFRGGYARQDVDRYGDILTDANSDNGGGAALGILGVGNTTAFTGNNENGDRDGWYFGAGIEHNLTDDLFGLWDGTSIWAEIMFEYKEFDQEDLRRAPLGTAANDSVAGAVGGGNGVGPGAPVCGGSAAGNAALGGSAVTNSAIGAGPYGVCSNSVHVTQFTLTASPKIKFDNVMGIQGLTPWVIPAGFAFHVISPPSDGVTVNTVGIMFAGGVEYNLWKSINVGVDARYHLTDNALDEVNIDGLTAGGYLGFTF